MSRRLSIITVGLLILSAAMLAAALQTAATTAPATPSAPTVTLTDRDNGKDIDLTTGSTLIVKLKSNPSTGYSWAVAGDPSPLHLEKSKYVKNSNSSKALGAPGVEVLRFNATAAGVTNLTVMCRRSWEYNTPPAQTFSVRVNVR